MSKVFVTRKLPDECMKRLQDAPEVQELRVNPRDAKCPRDELVANSQWADIVLTQLCDPIDAEFFDACPNLKVVANYAVGYNNIDVEAAKRHGVVVTNTPDVLTDATADIAFALLLAAARRITEGDQLVRRRGWTGWAPEFFLGSDVSRRTIGIVGFGRIGQAMARRALGFGMNVIYSGHAEVKGEGVPEATYVSLDDLLRRSDFVSLHCPLTPETRNIIDARALSLMKPSAILINTARGPVVNEQALIAALQAGTIRAAGLDVYDTEPNPNPELFLPNVALAPHLGSATIATRVAMGMLAIDNIVAFIRGEAPPTRVC